MLCGYNFVLAVIVMLCSYFLRHGVVLPCFCRSLDVDPNCKGAAIAGLTANRAISQKWHSYF